MRNLEIAAILDKMADVLEFKGEVAFKINAYRKASRVISEMPEDIESIWQEKKLAEIPGIGKGLQGKIDEYFTSGRISEFDSLLTEVPKDLFELLSIQNFGPKEYKASSQVWSIAQDQRGMMYFGTSESLLEFDGKNWRKIKITNVGRRIQSLETDEDGATVFIGTNGSFGCLVSNSEGNLVFQSFVDLIPKNHRTFKDVWKIFSTSHGIYFCTTNKIFRWYENRISVSV